MNLKMEEDRQIGRFIYPNLGEAKNFTYSVFLKVVVNLKVEKAELLLVVQVEGVEGKITFHFAFQVNLLSVHPIQHPSFIIYFHFVILKLRGEVVMLGMIVGVFLQMEVKEARLLLLLIKDQGPVQQAMSLYIQSQRWNLQSFYLRSRRT